MSSGRVRWAARSLRRTSIRRPPALYFPTRTPPTRALRVVATSSIETPMSEAMARSGTIRSSGWPEPVVRVQVLDDPALAELVHDLLAEDDELVPVRAAHGEFDREAALGGEALLGQVLDDGPDAGDGVQLPAQDGRELG